MVIVVVLAAAMLAVAALLALVRIERGPSMLDRALGLDLLASALVGVIAIEAAWSRRTETIPILVALSLVGFVGSVAIARFAAREPVKSSELHDRDDGDERPAPSSGSTTPPGSTAPSETPDEPPEGDR